MRAALSLGPSDPGGALVIAPGVWNAEMDRARLRVPGAAATGRRRAAEPGERWCRSRIPRRTAR